MPLLLNNFPAPLWSVHHQHTPKLETINLHFPAQGAWKIKWKCVWGAILLALTNRERKKRKIHSNFLRNIYLWKNCIVKFHPHPHKPLMKKEVKEGMDAGLYASDDDFYSLFLFTHKTDVCYNRVFFIIQYFSTNTMTNWRSSLPWKMYKKKLFTLFIEISILSFFLWFWYLVVAYQS